MIEVRDCYKNVKLHKKNIGLFPYHIHNHPLEDVHDEVEIVYVEFWTEDGYTYHFEHDQMGDIVEADKYCIYVKGDTFEGKPVTDMIVRTKYFYDFEVPDSTENIPLNEAQMGLKLNEKPNCVSLLESLENNDLNGVLSVCDSPNLGWRIDNLYLDTLTTWSTIDTENGTYEYARPTDTSWTIRPVSTGPVQPSSMLWSDADIAELREIIDEHRNNE